MRVAPAILAALLLACTSPGEDGHDGALADDAGPDTRSAVCDFPYAAGPTPQSRDEVDPTVCFHLAPPGPDDEVAELPMPDPSCCERGRPLFHKGDGHSPPSTLTVELGVRPGRWDLRALAGGAVGGAGCVGCIGDVGACHDPRRPARRDRHQGQAQSRHGRLVRLQAGRRWQFAGGVGESGRRMAV